MGDDFSTHWIFAGDVGDVRPIAVAHLRLALLQKGLQEISNEAEADRTLVFGPPRRWLFLGDSAGSTAWSDPESFDALSLALSTIAPVVDVQMSDSATVHFHLYRHGQFVDKFGNAAFPFYRFKNEEEAAPYRGKPELWSDLLVSPDKVSDLRSAWVQEWRAGEILAATARLFGWVPELQYVGYTIDLDGIPLKYDQFLEFTVKLDEFHEYHFKRGES